MASEIYSLSALQEAIRQENLGGWLFYCFKGRDTLANRLLRLDNTQPNTRPAMFFVFPSRAPIKILHRIEPDVFAHLPGDSYSYGRLAELSAILATCAGLVKGPLAVQASTRFPVLSLLDAGMYQTLQQAGFQLAPSDNLIPGLLGRISTEGFASHRRAAGHLYEIVQSVWSALRSGTLTSEAQVRQAMLDEFANRGLVCDHPPIVGFGANTALPHYEPQGAGAMLLPGQPVQIDLWAREINPGSVYADISWLGWSGGNPHPAVLDSFGLLVAARDGVVQALSQRLSAGAKVTGADLDRHACEIISRTGKSVFLRHRTGHSIDSDVHGMGVNLDSREFPDDRPLLDGALFSVEPGLYGMEHNGQSFGLRTEIDVAIVEGKAVVSSGPVQTGLLLF